MIHPLSPLYILDQALLRLDRKIAQSPRSLEEIAGEEKRLEEDEERRRGETKELGKIIRRMEREGDELRERIRKGKEKMKELMPVHAAEVLQHETGRFESDLEALELEILENMERLEARERETALRRELLSARRAELTAEESTLHKELEEYRSDRDRMAEKREAFLEDLDPTLRRRYLNIFKGHGYTTIAAVSEGSCRGCGQRLTRQRALDIQTRGELGTCQGCGRLLIGVEE